MKIKGLTLMMQGKSPLPVVRIQTMLSGKRNRNCTDRYLYQVKGVVRGGGEDD